MKKMVKIHCFGCDGTAYLSHFKRLPRVCPMCGEDTENLEMEITEEWGMPNARITLDRLELDDKYMISIEDQNGGVYAHLVINQQQFGQLWAAVTIEMDKLDEKEEKPAADTAGQED